MDSDTATPSNNRIHLLFRFALLAGILVVGGLYVWKKGNALDLGPARVLLVVPPPEPESDISHYQARALTLMLQDILECNPELSVTVATDLPDRPSALRGDPRWLLLKVVPNRQQERLGITLEWVWSAHMNEGTKAWQRREIRPGPPEQVFRDAVRVLPLEVHGADIGKIVPRTGRVFWSLIQASTLRLQNAELAEATRLARLAVQEEPDCGSAWFTLGSLIYRALLDEPFHSRPENLREARSCFESGLRILPGHTKGTFLLAQLRTNAGDNREALTLLLDRLKSFPRNPFLLSGVVYTARNAGLLDLARAAADRRDLWAFPEYMPQGIDLLFLYLGDWGRFEVTLKDQPGHLRNSVQRFYRGYLALLRGRPAEGIETLLAAESVPRGFPHYLRLARAFRLAAQGAHGEAQKEIRSLEVQRTGLRVPDGEFSLRMAEGYSLAGDPEAAVELAERAFSQGFGATLWFEKSPFLAPLQASPRWKSLLQHLRERQALLEARFPATSLPPA